MLSLTQEINKMITSAEGYKLRSKRNEVHNSGYYTIS